MKITKRVSYIEKSYPHIDMTGGDGVTVTCNKYPKCDSCKVKFICFTEATEIVVEEISPHFIIENRCDCWTSFGGKL